MNENIFGIDNFNLISDDKYYYLFRALNSADQREIKKGITSENGEIIKVLTNKQRYPENSKYANSSEISLKEVWDHTKSVNYYKGTNCISLSSNANVSIDYGSKYGHKYLMVRIPKDRDSQVYNAGQYMISELNRILDDRLKELPQDSEIIKLVKEIENQKTNKEIKEIIGDRFNSFRTGGKYTSKSSVRTRETIIERFKKRQSFSAEQELEYAKLMGKLTILELSGMLPKELLSNINIASLTSTIGSEFSNREFVHYGEISSDEFVSISKINLNMFALLQVAKEQGISEQKVKQIEQKLIEYTNQGYDLISKNGKLYYSNGENEIDLNLNEDSILVSENSLLDNTNISIEEMFEKTNGTISYLKVKNATQFVHNLSIAQRKTFELANVLKSILDDKELIPVIDEIAQKSVAINDRIITRKNGRGIQVSESVNIDMNRGERKQFSDEEQENIYSRVKKLSIEELDSIILNNGNELEQEIYTNNLENIAIDTTKTREERLNRYYAEAIIDTLDISKIYKKAIRDKSLTEQERENLLKQLEKADCKRLVNVFTKVGVDENEVSGYILNILASNGYQGYSFEELSRLTNLDEIIIKNINNTNLKGHVYPSVMEELRGIRDNENRVGETLIHLKPYQQKAVDNVDRIFADGKRFAGVVLPTGAGKSFVAMTEMLKNQNGNILYIAPQHEILSQVQRHILKNIAEVEVLTSDEIIKLKEEQHTTDIRELKLPKGKILPTQTNEYVKKVFPHLKMLCYQGLASQDDRELTDEQKKQSDNEEKELREILKNADANLIVFDELHRSGAKTWKNVVKQLIDSNEKANILGLTATPIRDVDHVDMMKELADMTQTYSEDELVTKQYLGYEMYLTDAIQRGLVVEPRIVSFDFMLRETDEYQEILEMIATEKDEEKKKQLMQIKTQIDELISGDSDISEHIKNNILQKENEEIGRIIESTIQKKDGRYIVFLPQHSHADGLTENQYFEQQEQKIREILVQIDTEPEIYRLSSEDSKAENHRAITDFENSSSKHLKVILAINKLNEGVHVEGINGEIMYRKINDGSTILYLQQLGRVIYSIDKDNPPKDEDLPIVYDIYNNYLVQNLNRTVNQTTPKSDLQKLQEIIEWIDKHGYQPDINSEDINEARKAITLKKIQTKYKKYIDGIDNPRLSKSDIYEIEQIMELAYSIDLFNMEIGTRIIPPGEKDLSEVQLFKITATQSRFLELYKDANKTIKNKERHKNRPTAKLNDIMNILETLNSNDIFIDNKLIRVNDTLKDVIEKCPEEIRQTLLEELSNFDEEYPIGKEYNFAKTAFKDSSRWNYFKDADVRKLYSCGIFEDIDEEFLNEYLKDSINSDKIRFEIVLINGFINYGHKNLKGLNVKTGTYFDENGNSLYIPIDIERKKFENTILILKKVQEYMYEGYSLANESIDEITNLSARDCVRLFPPKDGSKIIYFGISCYFSLKKGILQAREYLQNNDIKLDKQQIIEYKKLGILPLNINKDGVDEETGLPREFFGKSVKEIIEEKNFDKNVRKNISILKKVQEYMYEGYSLANESIDEIIDLSARDCMRLFPPKDGTRIDIYYNGVPKDFLLKEGILKAREYLQNNAIKLDEQQIIEYKKLGVLPLKINKEGIDEETGLPRDFFGKSVKEIIEEKNFDENVRKNLLILEKVQDYMYEGYSLANESIDEITDLSARDCVRLFPPKDGSKFDYSGIPCDFSLKGGILQAREYLQNNDIKLDEHQIIEYKKLGILPLNINKDGLDEETGLPRDFFGKSVKEVIEEKSFDENVRKNLSILKKVQECMYEGYSLANESIDEITDLAARDCIRLFPPKDGSKFDYSGIPCNLSLKGGILQAREYLQNNDIKLDEHQIIEYKKLGILPLNINKDGVDEETGLPREFFGRSVKEIIEEKNFDEKFRKNVLILEKVQKYMYEGYSFANESIDEITDLTARKLLQLFSKDGNNIDYSEIPNDFSLKRGILQAREYLQNNDIRLDEQQIIEYKKIGILPLKINKGGVDEETGLSREFFGKNVKEIKTQKDNYEKFEKNLSVIKKVKDYMYEEYSLANESIDEITDLSARDCMRLFPPRDGSRIDSSYNGVPKDFPLKRGILQAREYLQKNAIELDEQQIIEYKKLGILPLKINKDGIDEETGLHRDFFGKSVNEMAEQKNMDKSLERFNKLKETLTISTYEFIVCTANSQLEDIPNSNFYEYVLMYSGDSKHTNSTLFRRKGFPRNLKLREEIEKAREYLQDKKDELSIEEIIEYKKLGILPLNIDDNGIDIDTNLPRTEFEFESVDSFGFNRDGYYCKKQEDGTYINTGLKYTPAGFARDGKHVITKTLYDIRGFDKYGKCSFNNRQYDNAGFRQDGTHKNSGELYYKGYNAFGLDENGKDRNGKVPKEILFTRDYIINGVTKGKTKEIISKYGIKDRSSLNRILYTATQMCPQIKTLLCEQISKYQIMIKQREEKMLQLEKQKSDDLELLEKLKKENEILKKRISLMNPMQDFEKDDKR